MATGWLGVRWRLEVFLRLVQCEMVSLTQVIKSRIINIALWAAIIIYIFEYVGLSGAIGYGIFIACGEYSTKGYLRVLRSSMRIIGDLEGPKKLFYYFTLPVEAWIAFAALACSTALELMIIDIGVLFVAKLIMWDTFHLSCAGGFKIALIFLISHIFYGTCLLLFTSISPTSLEKFSRRFMRLEVLFFLGGYWFTWQQVFQKSHFWGYLFLCNPLIYASEGMRAAIMGQEGSLPFWWCCLALIFFTVLAVISGSSRLRKQLDLV